ncbi:MAG: hypothetical protein ACRDBH_08245 [Bosea sp. (in: a-proteobacteria)]
MGHVTDWQNDGTIPQSKTAGNWNPAAYNTGKIRQLWRPATASTDAGWRPTGSAFGYWPILVTNDANGGGIWLEWASGAQIHRIVVASTASGAVIGASQPITWSANQDISYIVDQLSAAAGASKVTVAGALSGNGDGAGYTRADYLGGPTLTLGQYPGFTMRPSVFGDVDDGVDATNLPAAGSAANASSSGATVTPGAVALPASGSSASAGSSAATLDQSGGGLVAAGSAANAGAAAAVLVPGAISLPAAGAGATASSASAALSSSTLAIGVHAVDAQIFGLASRPATVTLTFAAGSMIVVATGGKSSDIAQGVTSSRGEVFRRLDQVRDYPNWPGYGNAIYVCYSAVGGSTTLTVPVTQFDENTTFVLEIIGGRNVRSFSWSAVPNAGAGTTQTSGSVITTAPAILAMPWFGSSPVVGGSPPPAFFTAVPDRGAVIESFLQNHQNGEVQAALAVDEVSTNGSHAVTWTHSPAQGAQLWVLAIQAEEPTLGGVATASSASASLAATTALPATGSAASASSAAGVLSLSAPAAGSAASATSAAASLVPATVALAAAGSAANASSSPATLGSPPIALPAAGAVASASSSAAALAPGALAMLAAGAAAQAAGAAASWVGSGDVSMVAAGASASARSSAATLIDPAALRPPRANYSTAPGAAMPSELVAGDLEPDLLISLLEPHPTIAGARQPIDLTGAVSVALVWRVPGTTGPELVLPAEVHGDPTLGQVAHTWAAGETSVAGLHLYRVRITWPGNQTQHVPSSGTYTLLVSSATI